MDLNNGKIVDIRRDGLMIGVEVNIEASTIKEEDEEDLLY